MVGEASSSGATTTEATGTAPAGPKVPRVSSAALARAEEELEWRFRAADHDVVHLGAQAYDSGGGSHVFDEEASCRLHERHLHAFSRVRRMGAVDRVLDESRLYDAMAAIYMPQRWRPFVSGYLIVAESAQRPSGVVTLVGLLPDAPTARDAYDRARSSHAELLARTAAAQAEHTPAELTALVTAGKVKLHDCAPGTMRTTMHRADTGVAVTVDAPTRCPWYGQEGPPSPTRLIDWVDEAIRPRVVRGRAIANAPEWFKRARTHVEGRRVALLTSYVLWGRIVARKAKGDTPTLLEHAMADLPLVRADERTGRVPTCPSCGGTQGNDCICKPDAAADST